MFVTTLLFKNVYLYVQYTHLQTKPPTLLTSLHLCHGYTSVTALPAHLTQQTHIKHMHVSKKIIIHCCKGPVLSKLSNPINLLFLKPASSYDREQSNDGIHSLVAIMEIPLMIIDDYLKIIRARTRRRFKQPHFVVFTIISTAKKYSRTWTNILIIPNWKENNILFGDTIINYNIVVVWGSNYNYDVYCHFALTEKKEK